MFVSRSPTFFPRTVLIVYREKMHAVPIKPSRIYYRRDQEKDKEHVVAMSPKSAAHPKLRPASPPKRPTGITTHRLASETLQVSALLVWAVFRVAALSLGIAISYLHCTFVSCCSCRPLQGFLGSNFPNCQLRTL